MNSRHVIEFAVTVVVALCGASACGGHGGGASGRDLSTPPTHVWWSSYQGVQLPNADQGPTKTDTGAALGFARAPAGAALAAAVHTVRVSVAPDGSWPRIVAAEVVADAARDDFVTSRARVSVTGPVDPRTAPRLRGYRIVDYTPDRADVDVYTSYPDGSLACTHTTVAWIGGDWRLRLPAAGAVRRPVDSVGALPADLVRLEAPAA